MIDDGGPAFPTVPGMAGEGMTLRDWFAGQVVSGIAANPRTRMESEALLRHLRALIVSTSYEAADALIKERAVE